MQNHIGRLVRNEEVFGVAEDAKSLENLQDICEQISSARAQNLSIEPVDVELRR